MGPETVWLPVSSLLFHGKSYRLETTWWGVNDDRIYIFGWAITLRPETSLRVHFHLDFVLCAFHFFYPFPLMWPSVLRAHRSDFSCQMEESAHGLFTCSTHSRWNNWTGLCFAVNGLKERKREERFTCLSHVFSSGIPLDPAELLHKR